VRNHAVTVHLSDSRNHQRIRMHVLFQGELAEGHIREGIVVRGCPYAEMILRTVKQIIIRYIRRQHSLEIKHNVSDLRPNEVTAGFDL